MRATILPQAVILSMTAVSMMTKGCIVASVLPLWCFLFLLSTYFHVYAIYNALAFISSQEGSIATGILTTPNTPLSSLPVGSKGSAGHRPMSDPAVGCHICQRLHLVHITTDISVNPQYPEPTRTGREPLQT